MWENQRKDSKIEWEEFGGKSLNITKLKERTEIFFKVLLIFFPVRTDVANDMQAILRIL